MDEFAPLFLVVIFWIMIGVPIAVAKKAAEQKKAAARSAAPKFPKAETPAPQGPVPLQTDRLVPMAPTVTEPDHDDSVFAGSLGPMESEGFDPCHDEQLQDMEKVCVPGAEPSEAPPAAPGFSLNWSGSNVVRGIVMSEILKRKQ